MYLSYGIEARGSVAAATRRADGRGAARHVASSTSAGSGCSSILLDLGSPNSEEGRPVS